MLFIKPVFVLAFPPSNFFFCVSFGFYFFIVFVFYSLDDSCTRGWTNIIYGFMLNHRPLFHKQFIFHYIRYTRFINSSKSLLFSLCNAAVHIFRFFTNIQDNSISRIHETTPTNRHRCWRCFFNHK